MLCIENKGQFENVSPYCCTVTLCVEIFYEELSAEFKKGSKGFKYFSMMLDECTDIKYTAQLLIFIRGINDRFEIVEE